MLVREVSERRVSELALLELAQEAHVLVLVVLVQEQEEHVLEVM